MLITNVHILPVGAVREVKNGYIFIENGRIIAVGSMEEVPKWQNAIDGEGAFALPGFVDSHCHLGLFGIKEQDATEEAEVVSPQCRVIDSLNLRDEYWEQALAAGITTAVVSPGSGSVVAGQIAAINTASVAAKNVDDIVLRAPIGIKCALGENPKDSACGPKTRMGEVAILRELLAKAVKHTAKRTTEFDFALDALRPVLDKKISLHIHAHTLGDINAALRISEEFNIDIKIVHATGSEDIAKKIAEMGIGVICGPQINVKTKVELSEHSPALPAILSVNNVCVSIATDHPEVPTQNLALSAALAVKEGMPPLDALESITINAAKNANISDLVGSLEPDKLGNVLLFDKFPLEFYAQPKCVIYKGEMVT